MQARTKLTKFEMTFRGPHSSELFKLLYIEPVDYDHVFIGTGESKAVAISRALSHMEGHELGGVMSEIEEQVAFQTPKRPTTIEGDELCTMYCIIGISAE